MLYFYTTVDHGSFKPGKARHEPKCVNSVTVEHNSKLVRNSAGRELQQQGHLPGAGQLTLCPGSHHQNPAGATVTLLEKCSHGTATAHHGDNGNHVHEPLFSLLCL